MMLLLATALLFNTFCRRIHRSSGCGWTPCATTLPGYVWIRENTKPVSGLRSRACLSSPKGWQGNLSNMLSLPMLSQPSTHAQGQVEAFINLPIGASLQQCSSLPGPPNPESWDPILRPIPSILGTSKRPNIMEPYTAYTFFWGYWDLQKAQNHGTLYYLYCLFWDIGAHSFGPTFDGPGFQALGWYFWNYQMARDDFPHWSCWGQFPKSPTWL